MLESMNPYEGRAPLELNEDNRTVALRELQTMNTAAILLHELLKKGDPIPADAVYAALSATESGIVKLSKAFDVHINSVAEQEARHEKIRKANLRIRELEQERGAAVPATDVSLALRDLSERFKKWWRQEGAGHVSELRISDYGSVHAKLWCRASSMHFYLSDTPESDEADLAKWHEQFRARGFVMEKEPGDDDLAMVDCDTNRRLLEELVTRTFPSAKILKTTNHRTREGNYHLQDVELLIKDLQDLAALPAVKSA